MRKPKKFRSQIIAEWLIQTYKPCRVLDVGGGKGLFSYILNQSGFESVVVDPEYQLLSHKYTDLKKRKVKIIDRESVPRITSEFSKDMIKDFDLIVGIHMHGANMWVIDACAEQDKDFLLLPCCVIGEPIEKKRDVNWRKSLVGYGVSRGHKVKTVQFNFVGRNIGLYTDDHLIRKETINLQNDLLIDKFTKDELKEDQDYIFV